MEISVILRESKRPCATYKNAFTLVELLVVVAILSVLAALLMPALVQAQRAARQIACASQQKQINYGFVMYQNDFNGRFPFWGGLQNSATVTNWSYDLNRLYLESPRVFKCPSLSAGGINHPLTNGNKDIVRYPTNPFIINTYQYIGYGYNNYGIGSGFLVASGGVYLISPGNSNNAINDYRSARISEIKRPAQTLVIADSFNASRGNMGINTVVFGPVIPLGGYGSPSIHDRHRGGAVILWADGHVAWRANAVAIQDGTRTYMDRK